MFKNFEIKLNNVQSIFLILSVFAISVLTFALGYIIGKDSSTGVSTISSESYQVVTPLDKEMEQIETAKIQPLPPVVEVQKKRTVKELQKGADEKELTFFKTLPNSKEETEERLKNKEHGKEMEKKIAVQSSGSTTEPHPASSKSSQASYTVQVSALKNMDEASSLKSRLEGKGYKSYITTYETTNAKWFRVRVGQFNTKEEAEAVAKKLKAKENLASFITTYQEN
ncbi:MAG: SPOR domain-containing protein [Nitrospinota bacterium]